MPAGVVPKEAVSYLESKKLQPEFHYQDVWLEEHNHAFTVAKCMEMDLLRDVQDSLVSALREGVPYKEWSKNITQVMQDAGWWGKQQMQDPKTGEVITAQLGSARRIKTIFDVNVGQAYQKGVWDRGSQSKLHPYVIYRVGPSREHREDHLSWDGLVLPKDDPFWDTHWPRNGWGCKCRTRFVSGAELDRMKRDGITDMTTMVDGFPTGKKQIKTAAPKQEMTSYVNKRTGKMHTVPKGIDPGFEFNQGKAQVRNTTSTQVYREKQQEFKKAVSDTKVDTGKPTVSSGLRIASRKYKPVAEYTLKLIDSVHGDGSLPGIPLNASTARSFAGVYKYYPGPDRAKEIRLSNVGTHHELTLAHEIGHYLDHKGLPGKGFTSSSKGFEPMDKVMTAIDQSKSIQGLKSLPPGKNRNYYLDKNEEFARAYSQYILYKTGDAKLRKQLNEILQSNSKMYQMSQWADDDFVPIAQAMDDLFGEMGWIKKL